MPAPVDQLLQRARSSPSAGERHHSAWFALEALLKLAASARVMAWVAEQPAESERQALAVLARASAGHWVGLLRELALAEDHALGGSLEGAPIAPAIAWAEAAVAHGVLPKEVRRTVTGGVLGALSLGVSWRNEVIGHGAWRDAAFYELFATHLVATAEALLTEPALLGGATLEGSALTGEGWQLELEPLVVAREHPILGTEQLGFLNRTKGKRKRAIYLDYLTGETFDGQADPRLAALIPPSARSHSGSPSEPPYELLELLGKGGMGEVHLARQRETGRRVALKLLPEAKASDEVANERFRREVQALARVDHPAVVRLVAAGVLERRPYYAMEHIDGLDLAKVRRKVFPEGPRRPGTRALEQALGLAEDSGERVTLRRSGSGPTARSSAYEVQLAALFAEVAEGLHALHAAGVVHRDVKPDNLLLSRDARRLVLVDLGLASLSDSTSALTRADVRFLGTLRYIAPEQLHRNLQDVDGRADVFALGATLFELLTGRPLRDGDTEERLIHQAIYEEAPAPVSLVPEVSVDLDAVVQKATARRLDERYPSALALALDLARVARGEPVDLPVRRRRRWAVPIAVAAVAALGIGALGLVRSQPPPPAVFAEVQWTASGPVGVGEELTAPGPGYRLSTEADGTRLVERLNHAGVPAGLRTLPLGRLDVPTLEERDLFGEVCDAMRARRNVNCLQKLTSLGETRAPSRWLVAPEAADGSTRVEVQDVWHEPMLVWSVTPAEQGRWVHYQTPSGTGALSPRMRVGSRREELDQRGRVVAADWFDAEGKEPIAALDGSWGHRYAYDERGRRVREVRVGPEGTPLSGVGNVSTITWDYEDARHPARPTRVRFLALGDAPTEGEEGCAEVVLAWHADGRPASQRCLDATGAGALFEEIGCTELRYQPVDGGRQVACLDAEGAPRASFDGWAALELAEDERGSLVGLTRRGLDGELLADRSGVASFTFTRDERGMLTGAGPHLDPDGQPTDTPGVHTSFRITRERGRELTRVVTDATGKPADLGLGWVVRRVSWNDDGKPTRFSVFMADGTPALDWEGVHERHFQWSGRGLVGEKVFGLDGKPTVRPPNGAHDIRRDYDANGLLISNAYFGIDGEPILTRPVTDEYRSSNTDLMLGYHRDEATRNAQGLAERVAFFDVDGNPAVLEGGFSIYEFEADHYARQTLKRFLDADGELVNNHRGFAEVRTEQWDNPDAYFIKSRTTYDANGMIVTPLDRPGMVDSECASFANTILAEEADRIHNSKRCFGPSGQPADFRQGVHDLRAWYTRDTPTEMISSRYFDAEGQPDPDMFGMIGLDRTFDEQMRRVRTSCVPSEAGLRYPLCAVKNTHDDRGRIIRVEAFDVDGNPVDGGAPYARKQDMAREERSYDERGRHIESRFFDASGQPADGQRHAAIERYAYDVAVRLEDGSYKPSRKANFNEDGEPMEVDGVHAETWRFSPIGHLLHYATFGADGELTANGMGFAGYEQRWNSLGQLTHVRFFDAEAQDVTGPTGCAVLDTVYDGAGHKIEETCDGVARPIGGD